MSHLGFANTLRIIQKYHFLVDTAPAPLYKESHGRSMMATTKGPGKTFRTAISLKKLMAVSPTDDKAREWFRAWITGKEVLAQGLGFPSAKDLVAFAGENPRTWGKRVLSLNGLAWRQGKHRTAKGIADIAEHLHFVANNLEARLQERISAQPGQ